MVIEDILAYYSNSEPGEWLINGVPQSSIQLPDVPAPATPVPLPASAWAFLAAFSALMLAGTRRRNA